MENNINKNAEILQKQANILIEADSNSEKEFRKRILQVEDQRRDFFKSLILLIIGIIGSSYFLKISHSDALYFSGIILFVLVVIFIILYLRETMDEESNFIQKLLLDTKAGYHQQFDLVMKYLGSNKFSDANIQEYFIEYNGLPFIRGIREKIEDEKKPKSLPLEYFGEMINLFFLSGLFLIFGSVVPEYFNWIVVVLGEILLLFISCGNTAKFISGLFSRFADYLIKKMFK